MKVTVKGNTSKNKTFFPATEDKPAMLYFDLCETITRRDKSEVKVWHKIKVARGYAETIYKGLHGDSEVSRFVQIEGRIIEAPKARVTQDQQMAAYNTIWVDELTWLDQKWPQNQLPQEDPANEVTPDDVEEDTPW